MKKCVLPLMWFAVIALVLSACHNKKANEQAKTEDVQSEIQIPQELKDKVIRIYEEYQQYEFSFFKTFEEGRNEGMTLTVEPSVPLTFAEKARTMDQKCFLIGMYVDDIVGHRYFRGIIDEDKAKVVTQLAIETNLPTLASTDWDQLMKETWDELHGKKAENQLADFKIALDNGTADKFIQKALGAYIQGKYCQRIVREAMGELGKAEPPEWEVQSNVEKCIIELVDNLLPFYPSLETTLPLINDMRALHKEMTDEEMEIAYSEYIDKIFEYRAAFFAELQ